MGGPETFPLSVAQESVWLETQLGHADTSYNISFAVYLEGALDRVAFRGACRGLLQEHDQLRGRILHRDSSGYQTIQQYAEDLFDRVYAEVELPATEPEAAVRAFAAELALAPFVLDRDPLIRLRLLRTGSRKHALVTVVHHLVFDGPSEGIFLSDLARRYRALATNAPVLPKEGPSYRRYVDSRPTQEGDPSAADVEFWRQAFPEPPVPMNLPVPGVPGPRGEVAAVHSTTWMIDPDLRTKLRSLARKNSASLFTLLVCAFKSLLVHYGNDGPIFVTAAMTTRPGWAREVIGHFVNLVPISTTLSRNLTFLEALERVRRSTKSAQSKRNFPFSKVIQILNPSRERGRNVLGQILISYTSSETHHPDFGSLEVHVENLANQGPKADLALEMFGRSSGIEIRLEGDAGVFDEETVERIGGHLQNLLASVAEHPEWRVASLPVMGVAETHRLLVEWNKTARPRPDITIQQLIEARAAQSPDALAVASEGSSMTYGQLNARANEVAHHLLNKGVGRGDAVAICALASCEMVAGLLGIVKAGAAYVPLDPTYPAERLAFMIEDSQSLVLVTTSTLIDVLPKHPDVVCLDAEPPAKENSSNPPAQCRPDDLAYIIYTSGSTGRPKGVLIEHRGLLNLVFWHQGLYRVTRGDRATLVASVGFDASVWELWPYLTAGASVWIPDEETRRSPDKLWRWLADQRITLTFVPTPIAEEIIAARWQPPPTLRMLLTGGDRLRQSPGADQHLHLVNHYGPTECTVVATYGRVESSSTDIASLPPIGRPIHNAQAYVLDPELNLVPIGVQGELFLGGVGLARGYLGLPDLTAKHFIPNPFSDIEGSRLYRTGDLVRYRANGDLDFLGRADNQVSIRGIRIELGEIEAVLAQHPLVSRAVVTAHEGASGDRLLTAYFLPAGETMPDIADLTNHLARRLPPSMVPTAYLAVERFPMTRHGKIDYAALPVLQARPNRDQSVPPRSPIEAELARIWTAALGIDEVGVFDQFFELGGHSLLAVRMIAEVERAFGQRLSLASLMQGHITIERLARILVDPDEVIGESPVLVPVQPKGTRQPLFFIHPDEVGILGLRHFVTTLGPDQPVFGLLPERKNRRFDRTGSIQRLASGLILAMREVQPEGPYCLCGYSFGGLLAYEVARQLEENGQEVAFLGLVEAVTSEALDRVNDRMQGLRRAVLKVHRLLTLGPRQGSARALAAARRRVLALRHRTSFTTDSQSQLEPDESGMDLEGATLLIQKHRFMPYRGSVTLFFTWSALWQYASPTLGWAKIHPGDLDLQEVPGEHNSMLQEPLVTVLAERLAASLQRAQQRDRVST